MIVTNYAKKYEECNNYGYYKDFFEENYEACEIIKKCESMAREKYSKFFFRTEWYDICLTKR